ncbi:uncharacterized protein LOC143918108 isoform X2 [Arctopsyche grandis]|uniref:uncharacterized protein LOC143918108 isoform X2 n=1 Tax=Arctopsyche grandis TaxID=121162 RepID=UPI00406D8790
MESGQRLLGALELAGAVLITAGLAVRAAAQRICYKPYSYTQSLVDNRVLIIGADDVLQRELSNQFTLRGCHVVRAGLLSINNNTSETFYPCNPAKPNQLAKLAKRIDDEFGKLDIVVYATDIAQTSCLEPVDEVVNIVENNLMEHFHVVSQFVPDLARRSGCFVAIQPSVSVSGAFSATKSAIMSLSDSITQQLGNNVHIIRAMRRTKRRSDEEDVADSAAAILNAIETGRSSITLPTAKQHIKNVFRYIFIELSQLWNDTIRQQKLN